MPIASTPDHVAVAVPAIEAAAVRWHDQLSGGWAGPRFELPGAGFATRQLRFAGGAKLELLEPLTPNGFAARFLERFGPRVHHVTLKVADLLAAVARLEDEGYDVVDVSTAQPDWHEGFLRPSQVGGVIVQVAWAGRTDEEWAAEAGLTPELPPDDGPELLGPRLTHPDLDAATRVWAALGAEVDRSTDGLVAGWPGQPLTVRIDVGERPDATGLRFAGTAPLPADATLGPAVEVG